MTTDPTQKELTVELRGEMREGFARIEGVINALAEEVRAANLARAAENIEVRKDVEDHEARIRSLEAANQARASEAAELRADAEDRENRLREVSDRKYVSPMALWSTITGAVMAHAAIAGVIINALD